MYNITSLIVNFCNQQRPKEREHWGCMPPVFANMEKSPQDISACPSLGNKTMNHALSNSRRPLFNNCEINQGFPTHNNALIKVFLYLKYRVWGKCPSFPLPLNLQILPEFCKPIILNPTNKSVKTIMDARILQIETKSLPR